MLLCTAAGCNFGSGCYFVLAIKWPGLCCCQVAWGKVALFCCFNKVCIALKSFSAACRSFLDAVHTLLRLQNKAVCLVAAILSSYTSNQNRMMATFKSLLCGPGTCGLPSFHNTRCRDLQKVSTMSGGRIKNRLKCCGVLMRWEVGERGGGCCSIPGINRKCI